MLPNVLALGIISLGSDRDSVISWNRNDWEFEA
jgi:hypothetical protein